MSKALKVVEQQQKVFSILQAQIDGQRKQAETAQLMLDEIRSIRDEVNEVKNEVGKRFEQMTDMVQEVRDSVTLTNAECVMIQSAVAERSNALTKDRFEEGDEKFTAIVGKYRRMIWKQLKKQYNVPKYNCIRRIDYELAMTFIKGFLPEEFQ